MVYDGLLYVVNVLQMIHILSLDGVYSCPMCLMHLLVTENMINSVILAECGSSLFEVERYIGPDALLTDA